jgi:hypothetical protein
MQSTASVSRHIWRFAIPALLLCYGAWLVSDYTHQNQTNNRRAAIVRQHVRSVRAIDHVDGLVLGGSNAVFGLSAARLSARSGLYWYNASLLSEGFSDANYRRFVEAIAEASDRDRVRIVVYSTILPFRADTSLRRDFMGDVAGHRPLSIKPNRSALTHFRQVLFAGGVPSYPLPIAYGDFDFDRFDYCGTTKFDGDHFQWDDERASAQALVDMAEFLEATFPNARVVIVLPSEYYPRQEDRELRNALAGSLVAKVSEDLGRMASAEPGRVAVIEQPLFPTSEYLCDARHHGNRAGREFRTDDLFERLGGG